MVEIWVDCARKQQGWRNRAGSNPSIAEHGCIRQTQRCSKALHEQGPPLAQLHLIIPVPAGHQEHAVNVIHIQQQAHAVLNHDAGCQLGLLLQGAGWPAGLLPLFCKAAIMPLVKEKKI